MREWPQTKFINCAGYALPEWRQAVSQIFRFPSQQDTLESTVERTNSIHHRRLSTLSEKGKQPKSRGP
jgi:hypothetical protein